MSLPSILTPRERAHLLDLRARAERGWQHDLEMRSRCLAAIDYMLWTDHGADRYREASRAGRLCVLLPTNGDRPEAPVGIVDNGSGRPTLFANGLEKTIEARFQPIA